MNTADLELAALTHRLAECPAEFLLPPWNEDGDGTVHVDAVVGDLMRMMNGPDLCDGDRRKLIGQGKDDDPGRLGLVLIGAWLLADPWFVANGPSLAPKILKLLCHHQFAKLPTVVTAPDCVADADRREEFVRLCLRELDLRPHGESEAEAADRLASLDSVAQRAVALEAHKAARRAEHLRRKMAEKKAREAAVVFGRE